MNPSEWVAIFNIVAPHVFQLLGSMRQKDPNISYRESLELAGVKLDAEYAQLLEDMAQAVRDGAVPRVPPSQEREVIDGESKEANRL